MSRGWTDVGEHKASTQIPVQKKDTNKTFHIYTQAPGVVICNIV